MKKLFQLLIILLISLLGELIAMMVPLPIPACIYGMVLMLLGLVTGIVPLNSVRDTGKFLLDIMPIMFVPAAVGLLDVWPAFQKLLVPCLIAIVPLTLIVMGVSGLVTQIVLHFQEGRKGNEQNAD